MEIKTGTITVKKFNELYEAGVIRPYDNNRGGGGPKSKLVKRYATNWKTEASGCALLEKNGANYTLRDFHNRAEALKLALQIGKVKENEEILVRVIPSREGLLSYRLVNAAKAHTNIEKLKNTDLIYGSQIKKIVDKTPVLQAMEIPNGFYKAMAQIINDVTVKPRTEFVLRTGATIAAYINSTTTEAMDLVLKKTKVEAIVKAVTYWSSTMDAMFESTMPLRDGNYPKPIERMSRSPVVFGFVVFDYMFKRRLPDPKALGRILAKNATRIERMFAVLVHGNNSETLDKQNRLYEVLRG
jgi:hypothetical protein